MHASVRALYLGYWHLASSSDVRAVSWRSLAQSADKPGSSQPLTSKDSSIVSSAMCTNAAASTAALAQHNLDYQDRCLITVWVFLLGKHAATPMF